MGYKILLADDSVTVQKIITLTFSDEGVDVLTVNNGDEAISRLQYMRPALVMADVSIPGKNGYEICEFVKKHPEMKDTPVILLVPAFEPFDEARAKRIGADHFLTKPFQSIRTLISTVKSLIEPSSRAIAPGVESSPGAANGEYSSSQTATERDSASQYDLQLGWKDGAAATASKAGALDDILDLDDVLAELWHPPVPQAEPEPLEERPIKVQIIDEESEDDRIAQAVPAPTLPQDVIDEIVSRVAAEVADRVTERLGRELAPQIANEVAQIIKEQQIADKRVYREPEPLLELDEF